jgi:hypothetical protein
MFLAVFTPPEYPKMSAARLQTLLGLSDEELLTILDSDPLAVITGEEDARPEIRILLQLLGDEPPPRAWLRAGPIDHLLRRDFGAFEDALAEYRERGFVVRKRGGTSP